MISQNPTGRRRGDTDLKAKRYFCYMAAGSFIGSLSKTLGRFKHMNPWKNSSRWRLGAAESEESQFEINQDKAQEALRQLDQQLESLSQQQDSLPRTRPPSSNNHPEPNMDRKFITDMRTEMPEISDSFLAYSAFALVLLTIFNNIIFNVFIKPSVDGYEEVSNIQRTALPDPTELQSPQLADQQ